MSTISFPPSSSGKQQTMTPEQKKNKMFSEKSQIICVCNPNVLEVLLMNNNGNGYT